MGFIPPMRFIPPMGFIPLQVVAEPPPRFSAEPVFGQGPNWPRLPPPLGIRHPIRPIFAAAEAPRFPMMDPQGIEAPAIVEPAVGIQKEGHNIEPVVGVQNEGQVWQIEPDVFLITEKNKLSKREKTNK